jgi:hypothetical protein
LQQNCFVYYIYLAFLALLLDIISLSQLLFSLRFSFPNCKFVYRHMDPARPPAINLLDGVLLLHKDIETFWNQLSQFVFSVHGPGLPGTVSDDINLANTALPWQITVTSDEQRVQAVANLMPDDQRVLAFANLDFMWAFRHTIAMHPCIKTHAIFMHMFGSASLNDSFLTTKESCKMQSWPFEETGPGVPGRWLVDGQQGGGGCVRDVGDQLLITLDTQLTI